MWILLGISLYPQDRTLFLWKGEHIPVFVLSEAKHKHKQHFLASLGYRVKNMVSKTRSNSKKKPEDTAQLVECLLGMHDALGWIPSTRYWARCHPTVISAPGRWLQKDQMFKVIKA